MNILLVEDNLGIQKGLSYSLTKNNYNVIVKSSIKDTKPSILKVSFSKIIEDNNFGLPMPSDEKVNNAKKIQRRYFRI